MHQVLIWLECFCHDLPSEICYKNYWKFVEWHTVLRVLESFQLSEWLIYSAIVTIQVMPFNLDLISTDLTQHKWSSKLKC